MPKIRLPRLLLGLALGTLPWIAGCGPALLNAGIPRKGLSIAHNLPYASGPRHTLDVIGPSAPAATKRPVVVFFYGGGWSSGRKEDYFFVAAALARNGILCVIPDYRLYPEVRFPAFVEDGAQAVAWTQRHAGDFGGDPDRIVVSGHSAGAYIAAMLALDERRLAAAGGSRNRLAGMIGLAGPYDFLPITDPDYQPIFAGSPPEQTQPITFADSKAPPLLLLAGEADDTVSPANSINLAERIRTAGGSAETRLYPDLGHVGIVLAFDRLFAGNAPVVSDFVGFVRQLSPD